MPTTSLKYATSCANATGVGNIAWSGASNAVGNNVVDGTAASVVLQNPLTTQSNYLVGTFAHGLSAGDTINGVTVAFRRYATQNDTQSPGDTVVKLVKNGTVVGNNKSVGTTWPTSGAWSSDYGSASDLWGTTLTGSDTVGVAVSALLADSIDTAYITAFRATFTYTSSAGVRKQKNVFSGGAMSQFGIKSGGVL